MATAGFPEELREKVAAVIVKLGEVYAAEDATLVEVNPLVRTPDDQILALDGTSTRDKNSFTVATAVRLYCTEYEEQVRALTK